MVKVLVANEDKKLSDKFCQYLNDDINFHSSIINSGIDALKMYNQINPNVFVLGSHFADMDSPEIITRLSNETIEKRTTNIILTLNNLTEQNKFLDVSKIYKFVEISKIDSKILYNLIKQIYEINKHDDFDEKSLNILLSSMGIIVTSPRTKLLIEAINECYYNPILANNLNDLLNLISYKHNGYSPEAIRSAFRGALEPLNYNRKRLENHPLGKWFDPLCNISPKLFLQTITEYLYVKNNQDIEF